MRIGLYIFASIVLMVIIGMFIFTFNPNDYSHTLFDIPITLPIAVWFVIPMFLLMIVSVFHMMFYGTKNFFKFKKWEKDSKTLTDALYWSLLHEPREQKFNLKRLKENASLLQVSNIKLTGTIDGVSEKIHSALNIISELDKGNCVDFREKKLAHELSSDNPLVVQNHFNCLDKDDSFVEIVLQNRDSYSVEVFDKALNLFATTTNFPKANKYLKIFDRDSFMTLISRITYDEDLELSQPIFDEFILELNGKLKCSDFLLIADISKKRFSPDENLKLFKAYAKKYNKAQTAYLYLLFDYEMIEKAGEYLNEHDPHEFMRFRALFDLKKEHTKYKITDLMNIKHICNDL